MMQSPMYLPGTNASPPMMSFPSTHQSPQSFSALSSFPPPQQFIVQHAQQPGMYQAQNLSQQGIYPAQSPQLVHVNIPSRSSQPYVGAAARAIYESGFQGSMNPTAPPHLYGTPHSRTQMVPVSSHDERYRTQLIVNYLAPDVTDTDLRVLFAPYGPLLGAHVILDHQTGTTRGFGFVYYGDAASALRAIGNMNGREYHGKRLKVHYSINPINIGLSTRIH